MMTEAPSSASLSAIAYPMPAVDPVTSARFPASSRFMLIGCEWKQHDSPALSSVDV
jgi:hypothetical protein